MTRRGFITTLLKSGLYAAATPQIVTHGLGLKRSTGLRFIIPQPIKVFHWQGGIIDEVSFMRVLLAEDIYRFMMRKKMEEVGT